MKKYFTLLTILLLLTTSISAASLDAELGTIEADFESQEIPKPFDKLVGDERININIKDSELVIGLVTEGGKVTQVSTTAITKPTLNIYVSEAFIKKMASSSNPMLVLKEGIETKEVTYKAVGFFKKLKFGVSSFFVKLLASFGSEEELVKTEGVESQPKEELKEEPKVEEKKTEVIKDIQEVDIEENVVEMTKSGFSPRTLKIGVGETVVFKNVRGKVGSMVIGTRSCAKMKSEKFSNGESFEYAFFEPQTCVVVDGFMTTETMRIDVE
jgi:plastocyanin